VTTDVHSAVASIQVLALQESVVDYHSLSHPGSKSHSHSLSRNTPCPFLISTGFIWENCDTRIPILIQICTFIFTSNFHTPVHASTCHSLERN